jgi:hypothetical protein
MNWTKNLAGFCLFSSSDAIKEPGFVQVYFKRSDFQYKVAFVDFVGCIDFVDFIGCIDLVNFVGCIDLVNFVGCIGFCYFEELPC